MFNRKKIFHSQFFISENLTRINEGFLTEVGNLIVTISLVLLIQEMTLII